MFKIKLVRSISVECRSINEHITRRLAATNTEIVSLLSQSIHGLNARGDPLQNKDHFQRHALDDHHHKETPVSPCAGLILREPQGRRAAGSNKGKQRDVGGGWDAHYSQPSSSPWFM